MAHQTEHHLVWYFQTVAILHTCMRDKQQSGSTRQDGVQSGVPCSLDQNEDTLGSWSTRPPTAPPPAEAPLILLLQLGFCQLLLLMKYQRDISPRSLLTLLFFFWTEVDRSCLLWAADSMYYDTDWGGGWYCVRSTRSSWYCVKRLTPRVPRSDLVILDQNLDLVSIPQTLVLEHHLQHEWVLYYHRSCQCRHLYQGLVGQILYPN